MATPKKPVTKKQEVKPKAAPKSKMFETPKPKPKTAKKGASTPASPPDAKVDTEARLKAIKALHDEWLKAKDNFEEKKTASADAKENMKTVEAELFKLAGRDPNQLTLTDQMAADKDKK